MRAVAVFPQKRAVDLIDHPEPKITHPTEVKLRVCEVGICGTDREITSFQYGAPPPESPYLVIGHESLMEVVETGEQVSRVKIGDLAVMMVRRPCPHPDCMACRAGRQDFCYTGDFTERGIKQRHGFLTEFVVDDERYLSLVPPEIRDIAVLTEPLTIGEKGIGEFWQVQRRLPWQDPSAPGKMSGRSHRAVVLGAGPVGLLGAMALVNAGFDTTVYSRASGPQDKPALVASFGARYIAAEECSVDEMAARVGGIDLIYEATGAASVSFDAMRVIGTNGVFVFTGVPGRKGPITLDADKIMRDLVLRNQVVFGTVNAPMRAYEAAIRDLAAFNRKWPEAVRRLITGRFPITEYREQIMGRPPGIKSVIRPA